MTMSSVLLPQSPQGLLRLTSDLLRILVLKKSIINLAISALENFFYYNRLDEFDGHVGETLCQIRAYNIYQLKKIIPFSHYQTEKIDSLKQISRNIYRLIEHYKLNANQAIEPIYLVEFLKKYDVIYDLSELEIYLTQLHILSKFKFYDAFGNASIDYRKMCDELSLSKHMARRIIHNYQIDVSKFSTNFIYSLVIKKHTTHTLEKLFNIFKKVDDDERFTLPCYWVMDVMYQDMLVNKCPILIVVERILEETSIDTLHLAFKPANHLAEYEYCRLEEIDLQQPCFVIKGIANYTKPIFVPSASQYKQLFVNLGIKDILFANMADHPQYAGKKLSKYSNSPYLEFIAEGTHQNYDEIVNLKMIHADQQQMKRYAWKIGCGKSNPSFFYIRHIFCDTFAHQVEQLEVEKQSLSNELVLELAG